MMTTDFERTPRPYVGIASNRIVGCVVNGCESGNLLPLQKRERHRPALLIIRFKFSTDPSKLIFPSNVRFMLLILRTACCTIANESRALSS